MWLRSIVQDYHCWWGRMYNTTVKNQQIICVRSLYQHVCCTNCWYILKSYLVDIFDISNSGQFPAQLTFGIPITVMTACANIVLILFPCISWCMFVSLSSCIPHSFTFTYTCKWCLYDDDMYLIKSINMLLCSILFCSDIYVLAFEWALDNILHILTCILLV